MWHEIATNLVIVAFNPNKGRAYVMIRPHFSKKCGVLVLGIGNLRPLWIILR